MEDTWRENQEYALRQTRICFVVMRLFRWLLALLTIVCVGMGIWWLLRGETRAPAALGMAVCGAAMWMLIGAFMKPYARTAAEIVAALNTGGPPEGGYSPHTAWMVNCYINMHPAFFLLFALLWLILGAACLGGGGYLLASEIGYPSPHIPSLVMGAGLFTLGVAPAVMGLVYIVKDFPDLERAAENRINDRAHWLAYMREWAAGLYMSGKAQWRRAQEYKPIKEWIILAFSLYRLDYGARSRMASG